MRRTSPGPRTIGLVLSAVITLVGCAPSARQAPSAALTTSQVAPPSPSLAASAEPPASPSQSLLHLAASVGGDWTRLPDDPALHGGEVNAIVAGAPGLVAVGCATASEECLGPAAWTSADGHRWAAGPPVPGARSEAMLAVTGAGSGFIAVGTGGVWRSPDGQSWTRVATPATPGFLTELRGVTAWRDGYVAVGDEVNSVTNRAVVWTSADGRRWTKAPSSPGFEGNTGLRLIIAGGPGLIASDEKFPSATMWSSTDGRHWRQAQQLPSVAAVQQLLATRDGYLAVGVGVRAGASAATVALAAYRPGGPASRRWASDLSGAIAVAYGSPDGLHWTAQEIQGGDDAWLTGVAALPDSLVAVGYVQAGGVAVWRSDGAGSWSRIADPFALHPDGAAGDGRMRGVLAYRDGLVAWGYGLADPAVWVSPPAIP